MKRNIIYGLSALFLAVGLHSCGKTTKRKITNDWKIVSLEEEAKTPSNQQTYSKTTMTETTVSHSNSYTIVGPDPDSTYIISGTSSGVVKSNNMAIKKDGTWEWTQELFYENNVAPVTQNTTIKKNLSGTWSFVGKTKGDDFKRNERIVFNVLLSKNSTVEAYNQNPMSDLSEETTYLTGEKTMTFTVKESNKKELRLEMESASNFSFSYMGSAGGNYLQSGSLKMTLKEQ